MNTGGFIASELGLGNIPATRFEGACASGSLAIWDAYLWVASWITGRLKHDPEKAKHDMIGREVVIEHLIPPDDKYSGGERVLLFKFK